MSVDMHTTSQNYSFAARKSPVIGNEHSLLMNYQIIPLHTHSVHNESINKIKLLACFSS